MDTVVVAVFQNRTDAQRARAHLLDAGLQACTERSVAAGLEAMGAADAQVPSAEAWRVETKTFSDEEQRRALAIVNAAGAAEVEAGDHAGIAAPVVLSEASDGDEKSHPVGAGLGAAAGGLAAGALAGTIAGPVGTVLGAAAGALAGGFAGKDLAQALDPSAPHESESR